MRTSSQVFNSLVFAILPSKVAESCTVVVLKQIEGSLCGYFNKPFSQRDDGSANFQQWNAKQIKKKGVLIDFREFQAAYSRGVLCTFDDLMMDNEKPFRKRGIVSSSCISTIFKARTPHAA